MKYILTLIFTLLTVQVASANEALVTIRFQNGNVVYQDKLFDAVREAVKVKSTVVFDVTGAPGFSDQVANDIVRMGVNPAQVNLQRGADTNKEVKVFVR